MILLQDVPSQAIPLSRLASDWLKDERSIVCLNDSRPRPGAGDVVWRVGPRYEAERIAALVGDRAVGEALDATTDHAWLVLLGQYARQIGLIDRLASVPIDQRTREYTPQTKLIQSLVGVLAGLEYLQDFNDGPQPLVQDKAVIASWQQPAFAHYSGVSRTLEAADDRTLQAVIDVLQTVSQPFIDAEVMALVQHGRRLELDLDLTGRRVSPTSTTYPDADFGSLRVDDALCKGYQAALTSLSGGPCGRLLLSSQRYPGHAQSAECLQAAVRETEQVLGLRPRRRTDLVRVRWDSLTAQIRPLQARLAQQQAQRRDLPWRWQHVIAWGGLRGAVPIALALGLPADLAGRDTLLIIVFGVVFLSLLVQGLTMPVLLRRLGLAQMGRVTEEIDSPIEEAE